jgi:prevent-host-death family protein
VKFISLSDARTNLAGLVQSTERVVITKNGQPAAVLLDIDDFRALRAMRTLLQHPPLAAEMLQTHARVIRGDLEGLEEVATPPPSAAKVEPGEIEPLAEELIVNEVSERAHKTRS